MAADRNQLLAEAAELRARVERLREGLRLMVSLYEAEKGVEFRPKWLAALLSEPEWAAEAPSTWRYEVCKRCGRRNCIGFHVLNEVWERVAKGRWNILCPACFDEEAEAGGTAYRFLETFPVSWSDGAEPESEQLFGHSIDSLAEALTESMREPR